MQAEQAPGRVLKTVEPFQKCGGKLLASDQTLERLMHVERGSDKLPRPHGTAVGKFHARRAAILDDDTIDTGLRLERAPRRDEGFHQPACEIQRTALAQLITAFQVESAEYRA